MAKITIVGAGNSGCAHAAYLSAMGHKVTLLKTSDSIHDENFSVIQAQGGVYYDDSYDGIKDAFQPIACVTRDIKSAFKGAEIVFVLTQSLQHLRISHLICPYIKHVSMVLIVPGNLGSVFFRNQLPPSVMVAEGESTIIDARIEHPGKIHILFHNVRNALSFNPAADTEKGLALISGLIPNYTHRRSNVIETALHNPNLILHTIGTIMSAPRIEHSNGEFWMYREGFSTSIWNVIDALDREKMQVIEAFGGQGIPYLECCKFRNEASQTIDAKDAFYNYANNGSPKGPSSINNRYITEDVPNGLCLLSSLGKKAGIATPAADALIVLASLLLKTDFRASGRDTKALGWDNLTREQILNSVTSNQ